MPRAAEGRLGADGKNKGAVVRQVLLQVLSDAEAIYVAFHSALAAATSSEEFAALAAADARVAASAEAREGDGGDSEEGSGSGVLSRAAQAPVQPGQRDLAAVAKELERGLDVGVSAAMDRILQVSRSVRVMFAGAVVWAVLVGSGCRWRWPVMLEVVVAIATTSRAACGCSACVSELAAY